MRQNQRQSVSYLTKQGKLILETQYAKHKVWDKSLTKALAEKLGLPRKKIYKWNWERRQREDRERGN